MRALARGPACAHEGALCLVELGVVVGGPVECRGEARAAVQLAGVASPSVPLMCRVDQVLV